MEFCSSQRNKPKIYICYDCSNINGFLKVAFNGLSEVAQKNAEDNGHGPKTMLFTDLFIVCRWDSFKDGSLLCQANGSVI